MCHVSILPLEWDFVPLRRYWRKQVESDSLIPWRLARDYFRKPEVSLDLTQTPPIIGPYTKEAT